MHPIQEESEAKAIDRSFCQLPKRLESPFLFGVNFQAVHLALRDPFAMPIQIRCQCGKSLNAPDTAAGKAVKCPGCQKVLQVPAKGSKTKAAASPPTPAPAASAGNELDDLFDEEGFNQQIESVCPACKEPMAAAAVLCTGCGYHRESGVKFESHKTAGVDIDHGTLALNKAESDMIDAAAMQKKLAAGPGMPWWGLALVLFVIGSGLVIATLAMNASRRVDATAPANPMGLFLLLSGVAVIMVSFGSYLMIVVHAFKQSTRDGLLTLLVPFYIFYYLFTTFRETWKYLFVALLMGGIGAGLFLAAANSFAQAAAG